MTKEDPLPKFVQLSRGKLLIYLFNNLALAKRKILPNVWNIIAQHKYKFTEQIVKVSYFKPVRLNFNTNNFEII